MTVVTRFAPSPTGFLHIGGARTALFNWLYARHHGGRFLLRIEDTDRARSTPEAVEAIFDGLRWLGLDWDEEPVFQFSRAARHAEVANALLAEGKAYRCYATQEELAAMREAQKAAGQPMRYDGRWRDRDPADAPEGVPPVIRMKAPRDGETVIEDQVQGRVTVANDQLDDMILLRSDGTPTYMLSVVVDDHDMGMTHVIRGDDHLTNAFRQSQLYRLIGWEPPAFAHIPLIHGPDGAKLSKRHGALGTEAYRDMGFLPEAMRNYLLRLGWGHGDDEIISDAQARDWFDLDGVGRSAARFDTVKLTSLNAHWLRQAADARLVDLIAGRLGQPVDKEGRQRLLAGMAGLKERAKTVVELADSAAFYVRPRPLALDDKAKKQVTGDGAETLALLRDRLGAVEPWDREALEADARAVAEDRGLKLGKVAQPLRAALTGSTVSPPIFEVMEIMGRNETLARVDDCLGNNGEA
ncbi:glutamate--tRNA ligase [Rhodospira trueperi]|uniref:Glutamate--tRNA ligase n=1 Tax=Rhodospira trueperi TaxID=69960 RepID=A0A1G6ZZI4_9PROT|nr:glutamate--tRNA ligase [Rhodospira trueperi]SDE07783.1 glutamyl-tRNA synthetase [Rhodospira trueperi]